jgi:hypothetical protein
MRTENCRTTTHLTAVPSRGSRWPLHERLSAVRAASALGLAVSVFVIAFASSAATAGAAPVCASNSYPTGNPAYQVRIANDPTGTACLTIGTTDSSFTVNSTSNTDSTANAYTGFDSVWTGCDGPCLETNYEQPISSYQNILTNWSFSNFGPGTPGKYDGVLDMFINTNTIQPVAQQNGAEVMVWLNHSNIELTGAQLPDQTVEGVLYHVFSVLHTNALGSWNRIAFERVTPVSSISNLDLVPFLQAAETDGAVLPNWYLQYVTAGFEIWYGGNGLVSHAFSANTPVLVPGTPVVTVPPPGTVTVPTPGSGTTPRSGTTPKGKDKTKPHVSISTPACSYGWTKWTCNRFQHTLKSWTKIIGFASDNVKLSRVTVSAVRAKHGIAKRKSVTARAKLGQKGTWSATVKGLDYGTWKFTATAWDAAGNKRTSTPLTAHITVK